MALKPIHLLFRLPLSAAAALSIVALLAPSAMVAQSCKGNADTGCASAGASCSPVTTGTGQAGRCTTPPGFPKGERSCECQGAAPPPKIGATNVVTYHNDPQRTGWNSTETVLKPANVKHGSFETSPALKLDDLIDSQPLVVGNVTFGGVAREVVYVATEGNSVYAIDPGIGNITPPKPAAILTRRSLGSPVYQPLGCPDSGGNVGINSTPTIDMASQTMYVIAYTLVGGKPTYQLHALDIRTLNDKPGSPITITASHTLANGSKFQFDASVQRQRPGLLLADGNVYAGFGSFCDWTATSRGWLLGWNAATLAPLPGNELTDTETAATSTGCPGTCFLSSIWMSGFGIAAETPGDIFVVTGNSGGVYNGTTNLQESVVKMAPSLAAVHHVFTPTDVGDLDKADRDFGSGGVMVVPDQPGPMPRLAVAAGKAGKLFILNRSNLGGLSNQPSVFIGECWCGPSYYKGSDGVGRVISSGELQTKTWKINTALTTALTFEASAPDLAQSDQEDNRGGGFFTSVSSNGTAPNTAIIWALGPRTAAEKSVILYAFDGTQVGGSLQKLWSEVAGTWPKNGHANLVPTVANGRVYVASSQSLVIAGLTGRPPLPGALADPLRLKDVQAPPPADLKLSGAIYWGTIRSVDGVHLSLELRTGKILKADLSQAIKNGTTINPIVGHPVIANGAMNSGGVLNIRALSRASGKSGWGPDRAQ